MFLESIGYQSARNTIGRKTGLKFKKITLIILIVHPRGDGLITKSALLYNMTVSLEINFYSRQSLKKCTRIIITNIIGKPNLTALSTAVLSLQKCLDLAESSQAHESRRIVLKTKHVLDTIIRKIAKKH